MATQLFLTNTVADTHLGTDTLRGGSVGSGAASSWTSRALSTSRGSGVTASFATPTLTNATDPFQPIMASSGIYLEWISPPVSADVTISGTITLNVWASENNMSANVFAGFIIDVIRANTTTTRNSNTLALISAVGPLGAEVAVTTRAVRNGTDSGHASVTVNRGDRIRVIATGGEDATVASGFTWNIGYAGTSAAADGDTYVTFTENISFDPVPGVQEQTVLSSTVSISSGINTRAAASFVATGTLSEVRLQLLKSGSPSDNLEIEIWSDSAGVPNASVGSVATVAGSSLTTTITQYTYATSISLTSGTKYWVVLRRSGAGDASNYYLAGRGTTGSSGWVGLFLYDGASWTGPTASFFLTVRLEFASTVLYLTGTASDVVATGTEVVAWTSRGSGASTLSTNTATGWTAPIHLGVGATPVEWYTPQLQAFTLSGMAIANLRVHESSGSANASVRCEIARVDADGTNVTVWGSWCIAPTGTDNGELTTSEAARTAYVSGDNLAFTNGQRIRIRNYSDDISSAAMASGFTVSQTYGGTSGGASGDMYITLPQTVTEYTTGVAYTDSATVLLDLTASGVEDYTPAPITSPAPMRRRPAHRYTTLR